MTNYIIIQYCFILYRYGPVIYNSYKIYLMVYFMYKKMILNRNKVKDCSDDWELIDGDS